MCCTRIKQWMDTFHCNGHGRPTTASLLDARKQRIHILSGVGGRGLTGRDVGWRMGLGCDGHGTGRCASRNQLAVELTLEHQETNSHILTTIFSISLRHVLLSGLVFPFTRSPLHVPSRGLAHCLGGPGWSRVSRASLEGVCLARPKRKLPMINTKFSGGHPGFQAGARTLLEEMAKEPWWAGKGKRHPPTPASWN